MPGPGSGTSEWAQNFSRGREGKSEAARWEGQTTRVSQVAGPSAVRRNGRGTIQETGTGWEPGGTAAERQGASRVTSEIWGPRTLARVGAKNRRGDI